MTQLGTAKTVKIDKDNTTIINLGAATEVEMKEKKHRVEDALSASRAAIEEGIALEEPILQIAENAGIIDPAKLTRSFLLNAASVASPMLKTECAITATPR